MVISKQTIYRSYQWILLAAFLTIPLWVVSSAYDSYIIPKWILLEIVSLLLATSFFMLPDLPSHENGRSIFPLILVFLGFVALQGLSFFYATSKTMAIQQLSHILFLFLLYLSILRLCRKTVNFLRLTWSLLIAGGLTAIWTYLQDYHLLGLDVIAKLPDWRGYLVAGMGNSDYVAGFLASLWPVAFALYLFANTKKYRILLLTFLGLSYGSLIIVYSVGANAGLLLGLLWMGVIIKKQYPNWKHHFGDWKTKLIHLTVVLGLITLFYVVPNPLNGRNASIFQQAFASQRWKEGGSTRVVIWLNSWEMIKSHPLLGVGTGNFTYRYLDHISPSVQSNREYRIYAGEYTNAAHNEILQAWCETGILGAILICIWIILVFIYLLRALQQETHPEKTALLWGGIGGLTALSGYGLMSYPLHLPAACLNLLLFISLPILAKIDDTKNDSIQTPVLKSSIPSWFRIFKYVTMAILVIGICLWLAAPLIADMHFRKGKEFNAIGDTTSAIHHYELASNWADHADAQYHLGEILLTQDRVKEALYFYEQAALQRRDKNEYLGLAVAYYLANQPDQAIPYLQELIHRTPNNPKYWELLWMSNLKAGHKTQADQAHQQYQKLIGQK